MFKRLLFLVVFLVGSGVANAALSAIVTTAIENTGLDLVTAIVAVISAFVVFWALNKLALKLGWGGVPEKGYRYGYWDGDKFVEAQWSKKDAAIHKRRHGG